uniref:3-ketoacyl-CoA synthase 4-like n=1 Tax=Erigeron canadensis TaxID=72917 RepID=UPI001CB904F4|nr:3-ketoacyl-CoA synthase 4-like [Erigeron canadensis]
MATTFHHHSATSSHFRYVKLGYHYFMKHLFSISLLPLVAFIVVKASHLTLEDIKNLYMLLDYNLVAVMALSNVVVLGLFIYLMTKPKPVYLVDFSCYQPPNHLKINNDDFIKGAKIYGGFDDSSLEFIKKILQRSGLGDETYLPEVMHRMPPEPSMTNAREEAELEMFGALDNLFKTTDVNPKEIGILVVNCSVFHPIPSLSSMIVNKYKLRLNVKTFNIGGMGCSAGVIALDLAKDVLQAHRNTYAIIVSMENIVEEWYAGNKKSMLIPNCLFRIGCSAVLLSNKYTDKFYAKYKLLHVVRTHMGSEDNAFKCVRQEKDENGIVGVSLSRDLMKVAGNALKANITTLGPLVLPISEQLLFFIALVGRKLMNSNIKPYIPDFKMAFDHFCIHAGGKAVIDELEKNLKLSEAHVEPSRMTLYRFGNQSSSSIWYELAYMEAKGRMKKGHRLWQIAFGSGFKCNSAVWEAIRTVKSSAGNPWADCIHKFPVQT